MAGTEWVIVSTFIYKRVAILSSHAPIPARSWSAKLRTGQGNRTAIKTESAWKGTSDCRNCGIRDMVLFADLNEEGFGLPDSLVGHPQAGCAVTAFAP